MAGDEDALKRLLVIDENVDALPSLTKKWTPRHKADSTLYQRLWNAKKRKLSRVIKLDEDGQPALEMATFRSKKSRLVATLAQHLEAKGHHLNEPQLRRICDVFMAGWGFLCDFTLPESNEALARALHRHRRGST